jgi:hypothetical protein
VVGEVQPDLDLCCRRAVGGLSRRASGHSLSWRSRHSQHACSHQQPQLRPARRSSLVSAGESRQLPRETARRARNDQHPRQLWQLLHRDSMRSPSACWQPTLPTARPTPAPQEPLFATPFINAANGQNNGQPFPYTFAPLNSSRSNPDPNINWSTTNRSSGIPGYDIHNAHPTPRSGCSPSSGRQGPNTVFSASYVGNSSHRQRVLDRAQPRQSRALPEPEPAQRSAGTLTCGLAAKTPSTIPLRRPGERNPRPAGIELRQQRAAIDDRPRQLQRARTQRPPYQRPARVLRCLHLRQIARPVLEHRRRGQSLQPLAQLCNLILRCEAQLRCQLRIPVPFDQFFQIPIA